MRPTSRLTATEEELRQNYDELTRNQQALVQSEERYRNVVEDQTEFICRFSPDGRHIFVNNAYCRVFRENPRGTYRAQICPGYPKRRLIRSLPLTLYRFAPIIRYRRSNTASVCRQERSGGSSGRTGRFLKRTGG